MSDTEEIAEPPEEVTGSEEVVHSGRRGLSGVQIVVLMVAIGFLVAVIAYVVWATWLYGRRSNAPVAAPVPAP